MGLILVQCEIQISLSTEKRKLSYMNLKRKNVKYNINLVGQAIEKLLDGPDSSVGYRSMWQKLKLRGFFVHRLAVQQLMQDLDS